MTCVCYGCDRAWPRDPPPSISGRAVKGRPCSRAGSPRPRCPPWNRKVTVWELLGSCIGEYRLCWQTNSSSPSWPQTPRFPYLLSINMQQNKNKLALFRLLSLSWSLTLTAMSSIMSIFYGLMSLCTMFLAWIILRPIVTVRQILQISLSSMIRSLFFAFLIKLVSRSPFDAYSIKR